MTYINPKTKQKIKKVTTEAFNKFGHELTQLSNYKEIIVKENDRLVEPMTRLTLNKWMGYITVCIHNLQREAIKEKEKAEKEFGEAQYTHHLNNIKSVEPVVEPVVEAVDEPVKELMYSINFYKDGTFEKVMPIIFKNVKEEEEVPVLYLGLFDYNNNQVVVQKGGYRGCNVKNKQSILSYFRTMKRFEDWCHEKMEDVFSGKLKPNPDTSKDMATLNKIINEIEIKRRLGTI
jgi:hypothetical protein